MCLDEVWQSVATLVAASAVDDDTCAEQDPEQMPVIAVPQQLQQSSAGAAPAVPASATQIGSPPPAAHASGLDHPQQPAAILQLGSDDIDIEVDDIDAACHHASGAAAVLLAPMQKEARQMLAEGAGCSRAVPQHAVRVNAALRGLDEAVLSGGGPCGAAGRVVVSKRRITAACWLYHADQRGCSRAVFRTDVASLAGMLSPAGWVVEPPQASLLHTFS